MIVCQLPPQLAPAARVRACEILHVPRIVPRRARCLDRRGKVVLFRGPQQQGRFRHRVDRHPCPRRVWLCRVTGQDLQVSPLHATIAPEMKEISHTEKVSLVRGTFLAPAAGQQPGVTFITVGRYSNQDRGCIVG
eukprot:COSAG01_NODE_113_length_25617_cov_10.523492_19_plen_135_part_00